MGQVLGAHRHARATAGLATGLAGLVSAAHTHASAGIRLAVLVFGWLAIYISSHAIAHVAVGRAVGIRFRAYGVRGTDHPENYPPGVRQLMGVLPMWSALTDKASMRQAGRWAKAAMFAAGETSPPSRPSPRPHTRPTPASLAVTRYSTAASCGLLPATITVSIVRKGDYTKALRALGWRKAPAAAMAARPARERTTGPNRRGPRGNELRNAVIGWSVVNITLVGAWAASGGGFPWFVYILAPSIVGVGGWALQGRREAVAR